MNNKKALIGVLLDTIFVMIIAIILMFGAPLFGIPITSPVLTLVIIFIMTFVYRWIKYKHDGKL